MLFLALGDAKVPDARYFAFWWNIGLSVFTTCVFSLQEWADHPYYMKKIILNVFLCALLRGLKPPLVNEFPFSEVILSELG